MFVGTIRKLALVCCVSLCASFLGGCGGASDTPELGSVSGNIQLNGKPLADANIEFSPEKGRGSIATTDADGNYVLKYTNDLNGAVLGTHTVRITTGAAASGGEGAEAKAATPERIPPKYNSQTDIKVEVKAGNNTFDYKIESGGQTFPTIREGGGKAPTA